MKTGKTSLFKNSLINYFKSYKFYFIPLGCLFFFIIIDLSISIPLITSQLQSFYDFFVGKVSEASSNFKINNLYSYISTEILKLNWDEPFTALEKLLESSYLESLLSGSFKGSFSNYNEIINSINDELSNTITNIVNIIKLSILIIILGIFTSSFVTKLYVRSETNTSRKFWKRILGIFIKSFLESSIIIGCLVLMSLSSVAAIISLVLFIILSEIAELLLAYFYQNGGKVKLKEVINFKSVLVHILSSFVIEIISLVVCVILIFAINLIAGIILSIPIIQITLIVNSINAESYVKELFNKKENSPVEVEE